MKIYTIELKERVVEALENGKTYLEVEKEFDVPTGTMRSWVLQKAAGVLRGTVCKRNRSSSVKRVVVQEFRTGTPRKVIAEKYNVGYSTVFNWTRNTRININKIVEPEKQVPLFSEPVWISVDEKVPEHEILYW